MGSSQAPGATGWLQGARAALGFGVMHEQTQPGVLLRAAGQSCSPGMSEVSQTTPFMTSIKSVEAEIQLLDGEHKKSLLSPVSA